MTRIVLGIDPTLRVVSMARLTDDSDMPTTALLKSPESTADHSVAAAWKRSADTAAAVMEMVSRNPSAPELVVMPRLILGGMGAEPSGPRKAATYWAVVQALREANIPVADVPMLTLQKVMNPRRPAELTKDGIDRLAQAVRDTWPGVRERGEFYRLSTVALAVVGCMAVGIETKLPVTDGRLKALAKPLILPPGMALPGTVAEWVARFGGAEKEEVA